MMSTRQTSAPLAHSGLHAAMLQREGVQLFTSRDLDETRTMVSQVMRPHELQAVSGRGKVDARMHHLGLGEISLSRLCHGAEVDINPGQLDDFFLVMMPLTGRASNLHGSDQLETCVGHGLVASPDQVLKMRWGADCDQLMVRVRRTFLERMLSAQMGRPLAQSLRFKAAMDLSYVPAWQSVTRMLVECAEHGLDLSTYQLMLGHLQELVAATLLASQPHNHMLEALPRRQTVLPRHVHRVQEYLRAHLHEPVSASQLAEVAGVSLRSLYAGFQTYCGVSPMQYLRDLRLDQARDDLLAGHSGVTVGGVALRWGFGHLGRFSAEYKARHGESPSETLRRR